MNNKADIYTIVGWFSLLTMPLAAGVQFVRVPRFMGGGQ